MRRKTGETASSTGHQGRGSFLLPTDVGSRDRGAVRSVERVADTETERDTYWFVGGPLDGRIDTRPAEQDAPAVIRHVHLHEGPKIVHHYDLYEVAGHGGEYRLRAE